MNKIFLFLFWLGSAAAIAQTNPQYNTVRVIGSDSTTITTNGTIRYNPVSNKFRFRQNGAWVSLGSGSGGGGGTVTDVTGTTNRITSTGGATPVIDISASYVGQSSITTTGTLIGGATGSGFTVALGTSTITGDLGLSNIAQGSALSVLGVTGNSTADNASIAAGTDHQVLRRSGTAVGFGALNLAQSAAVTGRLLEANLTLAYVSDVASSSTAGGTVTLDLNNQNVRGFYGSASFATPKTLALSNTTSAGVFIVQLNVTNVAAVLTVPADWKMTDINFDGSTWTPPQTGEYIFGGKLINSVWYVNVAGPYN